MGGIETGGKKFNFGNRWFFAETLPPSGSKRRLRSRCVTQKLVFINLGKTA